MKVKELINKLKGMDQESDILCYLEDDPLISEKQGLRLLDIIDVTASEGFKIRVDNQIPSIRFEKGPNSEEHTLMKVTSDF